MRILFLASSIILAVSLAIGGISFRSPSVPPPLYRAEGSQGQVFFTFHILWECEPVQQVLSVLEKNEVRAIFFPSGEWLKKNIQLAQRILDEGHHIGNHTVSRPNMLLLSEGEALREIAQFKSICNEELDYDPFFFRPPYGAYSDRIIRLAYEEGCLTLLWSLNAMLPGELEANMDRIEEHLSDGDVFLFETKSPLIQELLPAVIDHLSWKGYAIEDPAQLKENGIGWENGILGQ